MRKIILLLATFIFILFTGNGCKTMVQVTPSGKVIPGQMKKETGSKSAKPFAPGQQKKKN